MVTIYILKEWMPGDQAWKVEEVVGSSKADVREGKQHFGLGTPARDVLDHEGRDVPVEQILLVASFTSAVAGPFCAAGPR